MKIVVMSRNSVEKEYKNFNIPTAIISIRCKKDPEIPAIETTKFVNHILFLAFDDVESADKSGHCITDKDAKDISDFVNNVKNNVQQIVVHCDAGVSRSAGVAAAIAKYLIGDDMFIFGSPRYAPNYTCYKKVLNALMSEKPDISKFKFNCDVFYAGSNYAKNELELNTLHFSSEDELRTFVAERSK